MQRSLPGVTARSDAAPRDPFARYPFGALALLAALLGLIVVRFFAGHPQQNPDSLGFDAVARSLLAGRGFTYREPMMPQLDLYAFRAPGYSVLVALGLALGGMPVLIGIQGAMNGLSAVLVGRIAERLAGPRAGWIAFAIRLVWPAGWFYAGQELSELPFELLVVVATWLALEGAERRRMGLIVLAGLASTAGTFMRPVGLGTTVALVAWLAFRWPRAAVALGVTALLTWAPWPARNWARLHAFVPFSTLGGATAYAGTGNGDVSPAFVWMSQHPELGEVEYDRHFAALAKAETRAHPVAAVKRMARWAFLYLGPIRGRAFELCVHRFAMLGALAGLIFASARRRLLLPLLVWMAHGGLLLLVIVIDRYRFPTEWCVVVAAGLGIQAFAQRFGARSAALAWGTALSLSVGASALLAR